MAAAKSAQSSYERELGLHAEARTELRSVKDAMEDEKRQRQTADTELAAKDTELSSLKSAWNTEKGKMKSSVKDFEEMIKLKGEQNSMLHNQIATYAAAAQTLESSSDNPSALSGGDQELLKQLSESRQLVANMRSEGEQLSNKFELLKQELAVEKVRRSESRSDIS